MAITVVEDEADTGVVVKEDIIEAEVEEATTSMKVRTKMARGTTRTGIMIREGMGTRSLVMMDRSQMMRKQIKAL